MVVVALRPGRFYGSSLPRPRYYTDAKNPNKERVDPPMPVLEPFLSWANEAHWSMGGLSFKRHRLQGRIEGNINKLRAQQDDYNKNHSKTIHPHRQSPLPRRFSVLRDDPEEEVVEVEEEEEEDEEVVEVEEEEEEDEEVEEEEETHVAPLPRKRARKLMAEFDEVAEDLGKATKGSESVASKKKRESVVMKTVASRTRSGRRLDKGKDKEEERIPRGRKRLTKAKKSS